MNLAHASYAELSAEYSRLRALPTPFGRKPTSRHVRRWLFKREMRLWAIRGHAVKLALRDAIADGTIPASVAALLSVR